MDNDELKVGFEYQGEQHYILTHHNHYNAETLHNIKRKDKLKNQLCTENNVTLLTISYEMTDEECKKYIIQNLPS